MKILPLHSLPHSDWLRLRRTLWPDATEKQHLGEMQMFLLEPARYGQFIAHNSAGEALGLVEVSIRGDHVNGTESSPVGFLEGLYVEPQARRMGVGRALVQAAASWAQQRGCRELASDTDLDNLVSQAAHQALGFSETERVVYYRKPLD